MGWVESQRYAGYIQLTRQVSGEDQGILPLLNKLAYSDITERVAAIARFYA